jgi:hypothetical protein
MDLKKFDKKVLFNKNIEPSFVGIFSMRNFAHMEIDVNFYIIKITFNVKNIFIEKECPK